jgi:hypothetical protein
MIFPRAVSRRWAWSSPLLHLNENFGLELSGYLQYLNSLRPQGANKGRSPNIVFLSETKASDSRINDVAKMIGFLNCVAIGPKGRSGGICLLWLDDL